MDPCQQVHLVGDEFGTVNQKVTFRVESSIQYQECVCSMFGWKGESERTVSNMSS